MLSGLLTPLAPPPIHTFKPGGLAGGRQRGTLAFGIPVSPPSAPLSPTVPRPTRHIQLGQPPPRRMRGAASRPGRAQALTATDKGSSGWSERTRGAPDSRSARRCRRRSQRAFCCVVPRGIYPSSMSLETHVTRCPTRLSAQYLISRLLSLASD